MAIACLRLLTFLPEPLFSVPCLCSCITFLTFFFCFSVVMDSVLDDFTYPMKPAIQL